MDDTRSNLTFNKSWIRRSVKVELVWQLTILSSDIQLLPEICWCVCLSCGGEEASYLSRGYLADLVADLGSGLGEARRLMIGVCVLLFNLWLRSSRRFDSGCASSAAHVGVLIQ